MKALFRTAIVLAVGGAILACARSEGGETGGDQGFAPNSVAPLDVCIQTDCPAPWATCAGGGLCATNTSKDVANCGFCGNACPQPAKSLHDTALCDNSVCAIACDELFADCNQQIVDGCEVSLSDDPKNCGGCGIACKKDEVCWRGACGCPSGFTLCNGECKDLSHDDASCGGCDTACKPPPLDDPAWICGPGVGPPQTGWGCDGGCHLTCEGTWADCNRDLCSDGCETNTDADPKNCGACGRACDANQECVSGECLCPPGTTRCGRRCVDTNVDTDNCGACDNSCDGASDSTAHGGPTCSGGHCGYVCYPGYADCNKNPGDGCEVDLRSDQKNCGGCGKTCDVAKGQPCVLGACLTKKCDPSETPK